MQSAAWKRRAELFKNPDVLVDDPDVAKPGKKAGTNDGGGAVVVESPVVENGDEEMSLAQLVQAAVAAGQVVIEREGLLPDQPYNPASDALPPKEKAPKRARKGKAPEKPKAAPKAKRARVQQPSDDDEEEAGDEASEEEEEYLDEPFLDIEGVEDEVEDDGDVDEDADEDDGGEEEDDAVAFEFSDWPSVASGQVMDKGIVAKVVPHVGNNDGELAVLGKKVIVPAWVFKIRRSRQKFEGVVVYAKDALCWVFFMKDRDVYHMSLTDVIKFAVPGGIEP